MELVLTVLNVYFQGHVVDYQLRLFIGDTIKTKWPIREYRPPIRDIMNTTTDFA
jgi:hypothetical protein